MKGRSESNTEHSIGMGKPSKRVIISSKIQTEDGKTKTLTFKQSEMDLMEIKDYNNIMKSDEYSKPTQVFQELDFLLNKSPVSGKGSVPFESIKMQKDRYSKSIF